MNAPMQIRNPFVGVDAHIDPAVHNCKIVHTIGDNVKHFVGADDPVRPWGNGKFAAAYRKNGRRAGRARRRPLQIWYGFALVRPILLVHTAGRTESSAPTGAHRSALVRHKMTPAGELCSSTGVFCFTSSNILPISPLPGRGWRFFAERARRPACRR